LLDDDEVTRASVSATLEQAGYEVVPVASPLGLRKALEARRPTVVVCDVSARLPYSQVVAAMHAVQGIMAGRAPLVLIGAAPAERMTALVRDCQAVGYLERDAHPNVLLGQLQRVVGSSRRSFSPDGLSELGQTPRGPQWAVVKVLLIDDSEITLELIQDRLRQAGIDVRSAFSLGEVKSIIQGWSPTVIVADVNMPDMRGDDLCARLKAAAATRNALVMLCSSMPEAELSALADRAGADGFVSKTAGIDQIVAAIESMCRQISNPRVSFG